MSQFKSTGLARVVNGDATVEAIWSWSVTVNDSNFTTDGLLTFTGSGAVGRFVSLVTVGGTEISSFRRVSGTPASGDSVTDDILAGDVDLLANGEGVDTPPSWDTDFTAGDIFTVIDSSVPYDIAATPTLIDSMELSATYAGVNADVKYVVSRDFTAEGIVLINQKDLETATIMKRALTKISNILTNVIGITLDPPFTGNALKSARINAGETALELFEALSLADGGVVAAPVSIDEVTHLKRDAVNEGGRVDFESATGSWQAIMIRQFQDKIRIGRTDTPTVYVEFDSLFGTITVPPVTAPSLTNSWVNEGSGTYYDAGHWKSQDQIVRLRGSIKDGTFGSAAFTLPVGSRPLKQLEFVHVMDNATVDVIHIVSSGQVRIEGLDNTRITLDGIQFRAEQ